MSEHKGDGTEPLDTFLRQALLLANSPEVQDIPSPEALEEAELFSETFEARMDHFLEDPFRAPHHGLQRVLRTAACFLLVLTAAFGTAMLNPSARAWVSNIAIQWYDVSMDFRFAAPEAGTESGEPGLWLPSVLPKGFTETERDILSDVFYHFTYETTDGQRLTYSYSPAEGTAISIDNEHGTPELATVWDREAHLMRSNEAGWPNQLIWTSPDGTVAFHLSGEVPVEDLLQMAESIALQG